MKQILAVVLMCALPLSSRAQVVDNFKAHTEYLASDELGGRGTGSKDIRLAAEYIAGQFKLIGLQPVADQSYYQQFPIPGQIEIEATDDRARARAFAVADVCLRTTRRQRNCNETGCKDGCPVHVRSPCVSDLPRHPSR